MITVIAARSRNRVIGKDGLIPWSISADLSRFKALTSGSVVIMGRKTFESIGKPLPNRVNIVVSSTFATGNENVWSVNSYEKAIHIAKDWKDKEIFIIGGERVYQSALNSDEVDAIELTLINTVIEDGDAFFPFTPPSQWKVVNESDIFIDENTGLEYAYLRYEPSVDYSDTTPMLYLPAARFDEQAGYMEQILNDGVCPFCPQWLSWYHEAKVEFETEHWIVTKNDNPYTGTLQDILLIPKLHAENFLQLSEEERMDFGLTLSKAMRWFKLEFGAVGMRFGDMSRTGGSVAHLHAHIKVGDVDNPDHQPIRFKMSSVPKVNKSPDLFD